MLVFNVVTDGWRWWLGGNSAPHPKPLPEGEGTGRSCMRVRCWTATSPPTPLPPGEGLGGRDGANQRPRDSTPLRHLPPRQAGVDVVDHRRQVGDGVDQVVRARAFEQLADAGAFLGAAGFRQGLKENGFVEGHNVAIEFRWADGQYDRLPALGADLVRRQAAVILTGGGEAPVLAVRAASATVPIVFNIGSDPVRLGLVASLGRPGGNATGMNNLTVELVAKRLGLLNDLAPAASTIAVLPTILIFIIFQRQFIRGVMSGAVKG